jgi:ubiquinone/menaquinone biosynthesis C-methylase UbiE
MNVLHNLICSSRLWSRRVERELVPWGIGELDLGDHVLELGPGFGATTSVLVRRLGKLDVLELDEGYCRQLRDRLGATVTVTQGDATEMPFQDGQFSAVLCFTMLHHIPSRALQDKVFAEIVRVLRPGGVFAGTDSVGTGAAFKLIHLGDTLVPVNPDELPKRLLAAGLADPQVERSNGSFRFEARKAT